MLKIVFFIRQIVFVTDAAATSVAVVLPRAASFDAQVPCEAVAALNTNRWS
jgi:hypothetical protein